MPPILNISRTHWKKHYSGELDRIICMLFGTCQTFLLEWLSFLVENEKISNARHKELHFVKTRLQDAIRKKLKNDFRLDVGLFSLYIMKIKFNIYLRKCLYFH